MQVFKLILFLLAIATSLGCTLLLFRAYFKRRLRLLMWSAICFACLTANNMALIFDAFVPTIDLRPVRLACALVGMLFLLYGFIFDSD